MLRTHVFISWVCRLLGLACLSLKLSLVESCLSLKLSQESLVGHVDYTIHCTQLEAVSSRGLRSRFFFSRVQFL